MDKKHILYITYDGLTDFLGQSQVLPYILGLEEKGYRFSILSYEKEQKYPSDKKVIEDLLKGKDITWYPKKYHKRFSILATVWDIITGVLFLHTLRSKDRFDAVHCRSYISAIMGLYSKKIFDTRFIFDMRGFWADERVDGGIWNLKNPVFHLVYKTFKWIEEKCLLNADYTITLTSKSYQELHTWKYISEAIKIKVIPCCVDLTLFSPEKISIEKNIETIHALSLENKTVISYLGSIGTWYLIDQMFEFFKIFQKSVPNAVFLFITPELPADILKIAARYAIPSLDIRVVKASRKEVPGYLAVSHYSLFFIKPSYSKISSSPTKLAEIMAMGVPVICNNGVGDVEQQVTEASAGIVISDFTDAAYRAVTALISKGAYYHKESSLNYVRHVFSLEHGVSLYHEVYKQIL
ncbi:MAG: glycosyltransferase [Cytophagales bacterium]|nr:glycosyltransferase [Cytophaga sp.]